MQAEKAHHSVRRLCQVLGVSSSGFYAWRARPASRRQHTDRRLTVHIRALHHASRGTYGSPRVRHDLREAGIRVGRRRVMRLMRAERLVGRPRRRFRTTTVSDPGASPAPNHLDRRFQPATLDTVWAADITALPTQDGWCYLAVLLDLCSRRVIGWAVDRTLDTSLVLAAWHQALARRGRAPQMHHSDRGCQYTSARYQAELHRLGVRCSMSRTGNCYDNAVVESFFRTLKQDIAETPTWATARQAAAAVADYIERFYNPRRRHSTLGYQSPMAFERALVRAA